ncbi:Predicted membrane protein [Chryseobacterium taklimakanense]|uniref:Predicted membrane protein n=1 Tax=Chryseobacterium taklimakanense TaxID=536441 RepID=A0A239X420_9FLAO|nr:YfhO family protein [Chryseobacterium taklimakanense]SNV41289.1 Predicted membrane protein [Chryseobacterium taklimakanense]
MVKNKNLIYTAVCLIVFIVLALAYANPVISGKSLIQPDIVHYKGGAKELLDYRANNENETYWSDSMFGGMPTYHTGAQFRGDVIKKIDDVLMFLPKPANYLFLLFAGFFLLGIVATRNWKYALLGATFFGLSTYFYIIVAAGHNAKLHTIAYFAPLLAGILLVYIRKKYILGFIVTALFMGLQISANHPQMTYYLFIALAFLFISELIRAVRKKTPMKHFLISSGVLALAFAIGVGMNAQRLLANAEYVKETTRGKQILNNDRHSPESSGLDKESITMWSYGKLETLNLFIPRLMGGGSQEEGSYKMMAEVQQLVQDNVKSQQEMDMISKGFGSLTYWGDQPGTSGPAYQGAVVIFLAILGFFFAWKKYRYWILGASVLTILLAWGHNFAPLTNFFIDVVPLYNKFRAPSSILVVVELLFPFIAILGLYRFYNDEKLTADYKKKILTYVSASVLGLLLILIIFGKGLLGFHTDNEKQYLPPYLLDYLIGERFSMFRVDAIKAFIFVLITAAILWFSIKQKISQNVALIVIGLVSLFDLWSVNKRYLNEGNFADKAFAENPFITENSDFLTGKAAENPYIQGLLSQVNVNKTLEEISTKDQTHYRIYNQTLGPFNETNTSYFKSSVGGYSAAKLRRYDDVINHYFMEMDTVKVPRILNLLNAKYMIFGNAEQPQAVANANANGNAWFVSDVKFVSTPNEEIDAIGVIDSKKTAVVANSDKNYFSGKQIVPDSTAHIDLKKYQPNELEYSSVSKTPQLAVFSEIYYPKGWKMFIDGKEVPYIKADYLLRAVHVPAGNHTLKMVFEPEVIKTGKMISMAVFGLFLLLAALGIWFLVKNRERTDLPEVTN